MIQVTKQFLAFAVLLAVMLPSAFGQMLKDVVAEECVYGECINGRGTMELKTPWGTGKYVGEFKDGEFHGSGRLEIPLSFTQEAVYKGEWNMGIREGRGTYWNGKDALYIGQWRENKRNGFGSYFFKMPRWEENKNSEFWLRENTENYTGEFLNDHYHGRGTFRWENGSKFEGGFFAGKKHGMGTFYYETGNARQQVWNYGAFVR